MVPEGLGTALKPATEHWILARKPLNGTVADNVLRHGTGSLNVDGCRVEALGGLTSGGRCVGESPLPMNKVAGKAESRERSPEHPLGRWPSNVVLTHHPDCRPCGTKRVRTGIHVGRNSTGKDKFSGNYSGGLPETGTDRGYADPDGRETVSAWQCVPGCPVAEMDRQSGIAKPKAGREGLRGGSPVFGQKGIGSPDKIGCWPDDPGGGASRFFPTFAWQADDFADFLYCPKAGRAERGDGNSHPTVKPLALCRWLVRLVTPADGTVFDPFFGSGTVGVAAMREGFRCVGIEENPDYLVFAHARCAAEGARGRQGSLFDA